MNETHLIKSWLPASGKDLTKRQAKGLLRVLKMSQKIVFEAKISEIEHTFRKVRLMYGRKPRTPLPTIPKASSHLKLEHYKVDLT